MQPHPQLVAMKARYLRGPVRCERSAGGTVLVISSRSEIFSRPVDVLVMGDDWSGKFNFLRSQCEVSNSVGWLTFKRWLFALTHF